jgi:hypothetical protein
VFWRRFLAVAVLAAAFVPVGTARAAPRSVRIVLYPIQLKGERAPARPQLERAVRGLSRFMKRVSYGRILVSGKVAPPFAGTTRATAGNIMPQATLDSAMSRAAAAGVPTDGALPIFISPSRVDKRSFSNGMFAVIQGHGLDRPVATIAHEFGHMLGLDHSGAARACPRPFRPAACAARPRGVDPYGDVFDVMGSGLDRFGAFQLAALGVAPVLAAPPGSARVSVHPLQASHPTLLRLRAATRDWFVESRSVVTTRDTGRAVRLPAGVAVSRVAPRYVPGEGGRLPQPLRVPASLPQRVCMAGRDCLKREFFRRGRVLTVPGAFRVRVLGRGAGGSTRVRTTWLDHSPPRLSVLSASIRRPFGGGAELRVKVGARATGAGVASVVVDQGGVVSRVDADDVRGLVAGTHGQGVVRVPLAPGAAAATLRLVDAAGNASAPAAIDLQALPAHAGATISFDPPPAADPTRATQLPAGRPVVVSGVTEPGFAGLTWTLNVIGTTTSLDLPIGPGGVFSGSWTPTAPGLYKVIAEVPVERIPGSIELRRERFVGWVRG